MFILSYITPQKNSTSTQTGDCIGCTFLRKEKGKTWNKCVTLNAKCDKMVKVKCNKGTLYSFVGNINCSGLERRVQRKQEQKNRKKETYSK